MKKCYWCLPLILLVTMLAINCGSSSTTTPGKEKPVWVDGPLLTSVDAIYAHGQANVGPNPVSARKKAEDDARQELGKTIEIKTKSLMDQFTMEHQDFVNTENTASVEYSRRVSRSVSQAELVGVQIQEVWQDDKNNVFHALAVINKNDLVGQIKAKAKQEATGSLLEQKTDEALKMLDKELEKWDMTK